jgi:hypothetical protein
MARTNTDYLASASVTNLHSTLFATKPKFPPVSHLFFNQLNLHTHGQSLVGSL